MKQTHSNPRPEPAKPVAGPRIVYSIEEVAAMLGVNRHTAYSAVARGEIAHIKIGRRLLVPAAWVEGLRDVGLPAMEPAGPKHQPAQPAAAAE